MPLTRDELGRRIRCARESCALTQEQLGNAVDLPRIAIGQVEAGSRSVSSIELDRIAHAVGRDIRAFFADAFVEQDALAALFRAESQPAGQADLLSALQVSLALGREMRNLERLLGIDRAQLRCARYELPAARSVWEAIEQGQRIAADERQRLGLGLSPIGDLVALLESRGVRTGLVPLPGSISGLMLSDEKIGTFVVINREHPPLRRRFSLAHEYAHVLIDRDRSGVISRPENRSDLREVRANAFAAAFLMPAQGVVQFVQALGKGRASRARMDVFDEVGAVQGEQRAAPGSQDIQIHDLALVAHHFGVSRSAALYRLKNLRIVDERASERLRSQEDSGAGKAVANFLAADDPEEEREMRDEFRSRFLSLALETYRREEITLGKFSELAAMVGMDRQEVRRVLSLAGLEPS
ncbi:ImmA/IrrE family metallo-endopeptidase [Verminephrobacter aporrectodeae subsp. tuberculatae]|uniref:ImmA/IrrE family metallo-endopeptidase n=1 Tax=Verminephrobacter aporrectodeae subsp. tuberculatae TaxID=1110392 RepID=A0ABT3KUH4_9BURK|nr:XRE family transcriptional regulator [Verminephrobacter aporrectodeae]MCW5321968.1 ImmA/IrrE family metallo-endopeptidase [Verminephrobacter aporrectodeae subsp. tuberculatae]